MTSKVSPTQRSLAHLRKLGFTVAIVEHWNQYAKVRQDLFGIIDLVALHPQMPGVLGIQTTSVDNMSARFHKSQENKILPLWIKSGNHFVIHGWGKKGARGKVKHWQLSIKKVKLEDLEEV